VIVYAPTFDPFGRQFTIQCHRCDRRIGPDRVPRVVERLVKHLQEKHPDVEQLTVQLNGPTTPDGWEVAQLN